MRTDMDRQSVQNTVVKVLSAILKCETDIDTSRENTPQWDSLKHIEIIFAVEDELEIEFSQQEMVGLDSVAKIVSAAVNQHAA